MFGRKSRAAETAPATEPKSEGAKLYEAALDWETARIHLVEKSERRAWRIAAVAVVCAVLLVVTIALMLPLKENTPYVIRVDDATGIPDIVTALDTKDVEFDEVMDKYWLAQYVLARETYDWHTIHKDYGTVGLLSSPNVGQAYDELFEGDDALDKRYGNSVRVTVKIVSIVPHGNRIGTVRFIKTAKRVDDQSSPGTVSKWIATINYDYLDSSRIRESVRLVNPFGFQVFSYRVDPEMGISG